MLNSPSLTVPLTPLLIETFWGLLGLILILVFHGSAINHVIMRFEIWTKNNLLHKQYNRVFMHFYSAFMAIALIHLTEILIWAFYILNLRLMDDGVAAIIFSGSCYTTVGFVQDVLPMGWKSLAFFISFTGLFSLAWTTSVMIGMTNIYKDAWRLKYAQHKWFN
jgi:hypothetical protein